MAPHFAALIRAFLIVVALSQHVQLSDCRQLVLKGSVSCLDCTHPNHDLSGVRVGVKCSNERRLAYAVTTKKGLFKVAMPTPPASNSPKCLARLLGGAVQLCASKNSMVSEIIKARVPGSAGNYYYNLSKPLNFFMNSCPSTKADHQQIRPIKTDPKSLEFGSEKTVDFEDYYGSDLPPLIFFFPFLPIIGIP